jgi:hypothetical protein
MTQEELDNLIEKSGLEPGDRERLVDLYSDARTEAAKLSEQNRAAIEQLEAMTRAGVAKYREAVLAANPDVPGEFVHGETYEEIDERLAEMRAAHESAARKLAAAVGGQVDAVAGVTRAGSPFSGLVGEAKIAAALAARS